MSDYDDRKAAKRRRRQERRKARRESLRQPRSVPDADAIRVFFDGDCQPNPGLGGWAAVIVRGDHTDVATGASEGETTNNRMELSAAIGGLKQTPPMASVHLVGDSQYVINGISTWIAGWKRRNWITAGTKTPVVNRDLWEELDALVSERRVTFEWVKGHNGHTRNEQADRLADTARAARRSLREREIRWIVSEYERQMPAPPRQPPGLRVYPGFIMEAR